MNNNFKITSFIGSLNNGMSNKITLLLEQRIAIMLDNKIEINNHKNSNIRYCVGCKRCFIYGECCIDDDINTIKSNILNSDLFIISTPIYAKSISGLTKSFIDRLSSWMHLMPLAGKYCVIVVCTYNNGLNEAVSYLYEVMSFLGLTVIGVITFSKEHTAESLEVQISLVMDYLIRLYKFKKCHSNLILEEKYKAYDLAYQIMFDNKSNNTELLKWIKQGYLGKNNFEEIIKHNTNKK